MPRQLKAPERGLGSRNLVVDNGGYTIKAGFAVPDSDAGRDCHIIPNCIARSSEGVRGGHKFYIGDQVEQCKDTGEMAFRRPIDKGFIVNWDAEMDIWKQVFFNDKSKLHCDPHDTNIVLTESANCPAALQTATDQILFEEFEFASVYRCQGSSLNAWNDISSLTGDAPTGQTLAECLLLVDSGYSHTTVTPIVHGRPAQKAIRRLDIGGKTMTNYLKDLVSLRQWNLMDDSYLVSEIKEDVCYVSQNFKAELQRVWDYKAPKQKGQALQKSIITEYVLPDYRSTFRGHIKESSAMTLADEQSLPLGNERFVVPELLFNPSDVGSKQAGLPETIVQSLASLPRGLWPGLLANIVVVGGNARLPGFRERLETELRSLTPGDCTLRIAIPEDPVTFTWLGGAKMASDAQTLAKAVITRQEYQEMGGGNKAQSHFARGPT